MALFLSPYIGSGTKADPFRPQGLLEPGASAVDIRLDPTKADGDGIGYALLWSPSGIPDPTGAIKLAEDYGEPISDLLRRRINARTGLDLSLDVTIQDVLETIMLRPDTGRWRQLRAFRGRLELWLGSSTGKRKWIDALVMAGGAITDNFNRTDEATLKYPWMPQQLSIIRATLASNAIHGTSASGQGMYYYDRSPGGWNADHSSALQYASAMTSDDWGPTVRNGASGLSCYSFEQFSGGRSIAKYVNGTASTIEAVTGSASTGVVYKIEVSGSTIRYYEDGVEHAGSPASDTSLTTAGFGPGVIFYRSDGSLDNFEATGEQATGSGVIYLGGVNGSAANGGGVTLDLTALSLQENDLVVLGGAIGDNDNIDFTMALVGASGWTKQADLFVDDTQDVNLGVWTKVMGATPDSAVVVDGQGGTDSTTVAIAYAFRAVDPGTPMDAAVTTATGLNTAHANPPSIDHNNPTGVATVVVVASGNTGGGSGFTHDPPANYSPTWQTTFANDTSDAAIGMGVNFSPADPEDPGTSNYTGTDSTNFSWAAVTLALRPAATSLSATINQSTTTDAAQAIGQTKRKTVGQVTETELAQFAKALHAGLIGQTPESNTVQAISRRKERPASLAVSTALAQAVTRIKQGTIETSLEADLAQGITPVSSMVVTVGQVSETPVAQAIARIKRHGSGAADETDLVQGLAGRKAATIVQTATSDEAQPISVLGSKVATVSQVMEGDSAQPIGRAKVAGAGQTSEIVQSQAVQAVKQAAVVQVQQGSQSLPLTTAKLKALSLPITIDLSQALARVKLSVVGLAEETSLAGTIAVSGATLARVVRLQRVCGAHDAAMQAHGAIPGARAWHGEMATVRSERGDA